MICPACTETSPLASVAVTKPTLYILFAHEVHVEWQHAKARDSAVVGMEIQNESEQCFRPP